MAAKLIEVFNNCKCVGEEQHLAAGEVRSLAFGDNRSVMVIELGLHEVVKRDTLAKAEKQLASAYGLDRVCIEPRSISFPHFGQFMIRPPAKKQKRPVPIKRQRR